MFWVELQRGRIPCGLLVGCLVNKVSVGSADPFLITIFLRLPKRNCSKFICLFVLLLVPGLFFLPAAAFVARVP